ncbi:MAG: crossover junction endodeoxyribonuclease RuvC [Candidatus Paceibacterota bacterium]
MIILGIDPGLATTGFGVVCPNKANTSKLKCVAYGTIDTKPDLILPERLKKIHNDLARVITQYQPKALVMENVFFFKNAKTIVPVCQAQGVILLAAAKKNIPVYRYTPIEVKMTITGFVKADKKDVQREIRKILRLEEIPKPDDAADALSIAATYLIRSLNL